MGIFGGRAQGQVYPANASELSRVVPGDGRLLRDEADLVAAASDQVLKQRFATVWSRDYTPPADPARRLIAVENAIVAQDREEVADLMARAARIGELEDRVVAQTFGVPPLPRDPGHRLEASLDLAGRDVPGYESPRVAASRALDQARAVRETLSIDRDDADRFRDISPLARVVWKHVPDLSARFGVPIHGMEGYSPGDPEAGNFGLSIHNAGADSRAASRSRTGFSLVANASLDMLVGSDGVDGMLARLVRSSSQREGRLVQQPQPARNVARDMSAAAFLSSVMGR